MIEVLYNSSVIAFSCKLHIVCSTEMPNLSLRSNYRISLDLERNGSVPGCWQPSPTLVKKMPLQKSGAVRDQALLSYAVARPPLRENANPSVVCVEMGV